MEALKNLMTELQMKSELGSDVIEITPQEYEQRKADMYNESVGNLDEADGYNCDLCKNKGYIAKVVLNEQFGYYSEILAPCKCQKVRNAIHRLNRSGLKNVVKDCTFDKYITESPWQEAAKSAAMRFCKDEEHSWLYMGGQSGSGKSHLCTAIAVQYIRQGKAVRYMLWRDEIVKIKASVNDAPVYAELMKGLKESPVLYIDDLFKTGKGDEGDYKPPTSADINAAFEIINYRYCNPELITIISSERTLSELNQIDEAIAGRIAERTKEAGYCLNIKRDPSRNWRMKGIQEL